jgi:two-component system sensor histidine kinase BaeS
VSASAERDGLALVVHEVKSPVAAITAIAEAVANDRLDDAAFRTLLRLAAVACRSVERIVGEAALESLRLEAVDVGRLVADATASAALAGARVRADVGSAGAVVTADPVRVRQALDNLIANAVAHGATDDDVVVRATTAEGVVLVSVSDTGRGIAAADHARIFERGVRLDEERSGSGLGLAVVRAIAEAHGGTLTVESAPGKGATFTIAFPLERR